MSRFVVSVLAAGLVTVAGCNKAEEPASAPVTVQTPTAASAIPDAVRAVVLATRPTMTITEATLKEREGRRYYDVEGTLPGGAEIELDLLEEPAGWKVVEIQRDIPWASAPDPVKAAAIKARKGFVPVRVIESVQAEGGEVIFELFAEDQPATPALEVMVKDGKTSVLKETWPH